MEETSSVVIQEKCRSQFWRPGGHGSDRFSRRSLLSTVLGNGGFWPGKFLPFPPDDSQPVGFGTEHYGKPRNRQVIGSSGDDFPRRTFTANAGNCLFRGCRSYFRDPSRRCAL